LLISVDYREMRIVGLLHPDAAIPFNPQWLPMIPFVKFAAVFSHANIATEVTWHPEIRAGIKGEAGGSSSPGPCVRADATGWSLNNYGLPE
jgi:hypothetical protein